jgi:hypothetical protein
VWSWQRRLDLSFLGVKQSLRNDNVLAGIACRSRVNLSAVPALERLSFLPALGVRVLRDSLTPNKRRYFMGLDMFAMTTNHTPESPVDFKADNPTELHYWRKHPNLHGWMEDLYRTKGGTAESFNCVTLQLTLDDLSQLEAAIQAQELPDTRGFFFGESDGSECEDDLAFIAKAREAISQGLTVFYDSWW